MLAGSTPEEGASPCGKNGESSRKGQNQKLNSVGYIAANL